MGVKMSAQQRDGPSEVVAIREVPGQGRRRRQQDRSKHIFLLPAALLILVFSIFPLLFSLALSFLSWDLSRLTGGIRWIGLNNFVTLASDQRFWNAARVTATFVLGAVVLEYGLGLGVALLVNRDIRFKRFFRVIFLMPMMLTPAAVGYVGRMLFNESMGPVNNIIQSLGGPFIPWTSSPTLALPSLMLIDAWEWTPFMFIVLLAGLQSLPTEVFEAATVDGASTWQTFRFITFPLIIPTSVTVVLIRGLEAFKLFDIVAVMTGGGPGNATESVTWYTYLTALTYGRLGYASALAYSLLIMVIIFSMAFLAIMQRRIAQAQ
jgi:multiple sugar transport system permease protein